MTLNPDQQKALEFTKTFWFSDHQAMVVDGKGGVGKSYLVDSILQTIPRINPLLIAPTHEALKQLKDKTPGDYEFRTAHGALGIAPIEEEKELRFEQLTLPSIWDDINLVVADESSMYHNVIMNLLLQTQTKIIFVGHKSQLPPPEKKRKIFDKCISPVFAQGFPTVTLTIPQRNTGALWDFNNLLEENIYKEGRAYIPTDYDIGKKDLNTYLSSTGKDSIYEGETKVVLWTNLGVDSYNQKVRKIIHGDGAIAKKYIAGDKILLTQPLVGVEALEKHHESSLKKLNRDNLPYYYSNAKAVVISCEEKMVKLNLTLHIPVYKLTVNCEGEIATFYEPVYHADHDRIAQYYEHAAWNEKTAVGKKRAYRHRNFIRSCFAHCKHFYAATSHRLQGSSIPNIIMILSDIQKNPNVVERNKCTYVAGSRAIDNLMIYRGIT